MPGVERSNQEKGHPASAPHGPLAREVRVRAAGFVDRASCPDAKLARIHASHPSGYSSARPPLQRGGEERRACCAHFSEERKPERRHKPKPKPKPKAKTKPQALRKGTKRFCSSGNDLRKRWDGPSTTRWARSGRE